MEPRIYVYKITFVDQPYWYWGYHKERRFDEYYMGSPVTNKRYWEMFEPIKEIVEIFDYSEEGEVLAQLRENELIKPDLNNPLCLNEHYGGVVFSRALSESAKKLWESQEYREKMLSITRSPEFRVKMAESSRKVWEDNPERRNSHSAMMKEVWNNAEHRQKMSQAISKWSKGRWEDSKYREKMRLILGEASKERWKDPEYRNKITQAMGEASKERWKDPEYRDRLSKFMENLWKEPKHKEKVSNRLKEKWKDPEYRDKVRASRSNKVDDSFMDLVNQRFRDVLNSDIDLNVFGWVTKVASLWGVSHAQVKRIFDKYWEGPPPYRR